MKYIIFSLLILLSANCSPQSAKYQQINFRPESFDWNPNPYVFSSYIKDSILTNKGNQYAACDFSCIGNIQMVHEIWDSNTGIKKDLTKELKDSFRLLKKVNAIDYILDMAKSHQVVIINEAHHMPQHRVFTTQLLEGLRKQGYKHLGLETYISQESNDSLIKTNGYANLKSGFYTKEPQFGNLLREALKNEYKLFGYESEKHNNGKEREINQAKNIQEYLLKYPNEKVIIHCGFDHGFEGDLGSSWEKAMAGRLFEFTMIDPLTINQVRFSERFKREFENPYYQNFDEVNPTVFIDKNGKSFGNDKKEAWFDIFVFHPRSKYNERASWLKYNEREEIRFSFEDSNIECPCLVFAYKNGERIESAIPYDIQETNSKITNLVLDKSEFQIVILNKNGKALMTKHKRSN
jgi:hypothetical protein